MLRVAVRTSGGDGLDAARGAADGAPNVRVVDCEATESDVLVTVGERALVAAAEAGERRPILAVDPEDDGNGGHGGNADHDIDRDGDADSDIDAAAAVDTADPTASLPAALAALNRWAASGGQSLPTAAHRPLALSVGSKRASAVADCTLLTSKPARISEYAIEHDGRSVSTFRADGVVVTTPFGSDGYGRAAGGPRLAPETGVAVVPIAPFATKADTWVLQPPLTLRVERDDDVTVFADSRPLETGGAGLTVRLTAGEPLSVVDPAALGERGQVEKL